MDGDVHMDVHTAAVDRITVEYSAVLCSAVRCSHQVFLNIVGLRACAMHSWVGILTLPEFSVNGDVFVRVQQDEPL